MGDAFGRPLADELARRERDLSSLRNVITGGAIMTAKLKAELLAALPRITIIDSAGSSETGGQGTQVSNAQTGASTGRFRLSAHNAVLSDDLTHTLPPGHEGLGWWARTGNIPLGYLDDEAKTRATFPEVDGVRYSVPGDKVRLLEDNTLELHGRESVTINSGGEKIFAEEVEQALKHHPGRVRRGGHGASVGALGQRGRRHRQVPGRHARGGGQPPGGVRQAYRPLQAAEGVPGGSGDLPQSVRQGGLPVGEGAGELTVSRR